MITKDTPCIARAHPPHPPVGQKAPGAGYGADGMPCRATVEDTTKDAFAIVVDVEPYSGIPAIVRLRSFLKSALRAWRIRCRRIEPLGDDPGIGHARTPPATPTRQKRRQTRWKPLGKTSQTLPKLSI
jgi:hypothetical protein